MLNLKIFTVKSTFRHTTSYHLLAHAMQPYTPKNTPQRHPCLFPNNIYIMYYKILYFPRSRNRTPDDDKLASFEKSLFLPHQTVSFDQVRKWELMKLIKSYFVSNFFIFLSCKMATLFRAKNMGAIVLTPMPLHVVSSFSANILDCVYSFISGLLLFTSIFLFSIQNLSIKLWYP